MSKITHITTIILLLASCTIQSQNSIKEYVKENTVEIDRINPYTGDFTDLESFGNAIGDAKIVMLGEQDHGDAPAALQRKVVETGADIGIAIDGDGDRLVMVDAQGEIYDVESIWCIANRDYFGT